MDELSNLFYWSSDSWWCLVRNPLGALGIAGLFVCPILPFAISTFPEVLVQVGRGRLDMVRWRLRGHDGDLFLVVWQHSMMTTGQV